jgi:hypothetical protein
MPAGVFVDRSPRRPMMIGASVVRGLALVSLPFAFALHHATLGQFFVVSFVVGLASVVFDSAYVAFFPTLVAREHVAEGNAKMSMGSSGAEAISAFALARIPVANRKRAASAPRRGRCTANFWRVWGMLPIGVLVGGYLGTTLGIVPTMIVGGSIALGAAT